MSITLPPLPNFREWPYSHEELRARDIEVARVVLEACAKACAPPVFSHEADACVAHNCIAAIRALEIKHE